MDRQPIGRRNARVSRMLLATAVSLLGHVASAATTRNWNVGDGNWNADVNWSPSGVPAGGDTINVFSTDGVSRTITYDYPGAAVSLASLTVGLTGGGPSDTETLLMTANNLNCTGLFVGRAVGGASNGTFTQSGGINSVILSYIGYNLGDTGFYNLSGSGSFVDHGYEYIGVSGSGTFTQSGGTHTNDGPYSLYVGDASGSSGTYVLSAGSFTFSAPEWIGIRGTGTFIQSGGTHNMTGGSSLYLGYVSGGNGTYTLSAGTLSAGGGSEYVGFNSTGAFNQTGGVNTGISELNIGTNPGATGTYALSGSGVIISKSETVGDGGTGTFNQMGGTNNITNPNNLPIGLKVGSTGAFNLSGGSVNVAGSLGGCYVSGILNVSGTGVLTEAGTLQVVPTTGAAVNLSGGTINTGALNVNGTLAHFNWTGGTLNITTNVTWDPTAGSATTGAIFGSALTLGNNQTLMVTGNETLSGAGGFSLVIDTGSTHYVTGTLTLNPTGTITQNGGSTLYAATFTQAGGTVFGTLQNQGIFNYQSGAFNGRLLNQGSVNLGPNFVTPNGVENDMSMTLSAGQTVTANGAGFDNLGLLVLNGGTASGNGPVTNEFGATIQGHGTINPPVSNYGTLSVSGVMAAAGGTTNFGLVQGNGSISGPFSNDVTGTVAVAAGNSLAITSDWANPGFISLQGATARLGGGAIANSGSIQGLGLINSAVVNTGTIEALGGTLSLGSMLTNSAGGLLTASAGSKLIVTSGLATNAGVIYLTGGTFDNNGHPLDNTGEISGWGIFRTGGAGLDNHGSMTFSGGITTVNGPLTNENGQMITVAHNPAIFTGLVTNNGGATFTVTDATATFAGGFTNNGASYFAKAGNGALQINSPPTLKSASALHLADSGTLRFQAVAGAAMIGTGVIAAVADSATLELAGSVSALSSATSRVDILNNSAAAAGILVSGAHQQVANIDGSGTTQVNAGSDLTANHIIQGALVIGSATGSPALATIAASDASGDPLVSLAALASPIPGTPFGTDSILGSSFDGDSITTSQTSLVSGIAPNATAVPEPAALILLAIGSLALARSGIHRRSRT